MSGVSSNIEAVHRRIVQTCRLSGRKTSEITCVAVTKGVGVSLIEEALLGGMTILGESRIQEARTKIAQIGARASWHLVGHLQTNKVKNALGLFDMIQSVDSLKVAETINRSGESAGKTMEILLEINIGNEMTKFGFRENEIENTVALVRKLPYLNLKGLMTIAPYADDPEKARPYFRRMKECFERISGMDILSMGMSHDFEIAIEEGATMIRIGQAIFGPRIK